MTKLPIVSSKEVIEALKKAGFEYAPKRGKGSHIAMMRVECGLSPKLVIIPHSKSLPKGTLRSILKQAGLRREEFIELLSR